MERLQLNDEALKKLVDGIYSAVKAEVIIGVEKLPNGCQHITVGLSDRELVLYEFFYNPKKNGKEPKHTGGKKSYSRIYTEWLMDNKDIDIDVLGMLTKLSVHINWGTGILCHTNRSKKPLKAKDIKKIIGRSDKTTTKLLDTAKEYKLLEQTPEGYKVCKNFMAKGVS